MNGLNYQAEHSRHFFTWNVLDMIAEALHRPPFKPTSEMYSLSQNANHAILDPSDVSENGNS